MNSIAVSDAPPYAAEETPSAPRRLARFAGGWALFVLALLVGGAARFYGPITQGFPVGDGGMFLVAGQEVARHGFALPATLPYPTLGPSVPFCYPPLSFYVLALLSFLGVPMEAGMRFLPPIFATLSIAMVWHLARAVFERYRERELLAGLGALLWSLSPYSFLWMILGGSLPRTPAFVLALWGIERGLRLWRDGQRRAFWPMTILLALALATHLERARFFAIGLFVVWAVYDRSARGLKLYGGALALALALTSPWWGLCVARFGVAPFLSALASGGGRQEYAWQWAMPLATEVEFPLLFCLALAGFWIGRKGKSPGLGFVFAWFGAIWLLETRSGTTFVTVPIALAASAFLVGLPRRALWPVSVCVVGWMMMSSAPLARNIVALSPAERTAMAWCQANTPPQARFAVISNTFSWAADRQGEWFPALARRASPFTVQSSEWLARGVFTRQQRVRRRLLEAHSWSELQHDLDGSGQSCSYIFWTRVTSSQASRFAIQTALERDPAWHRIFANDDVLIFERVR